MKTKLSSQSTSSDEPGVWASMGLSVVKFVIFSVVGSMLTKGSKRENDALGDGLMQGIRYVKNKINH